MLLLESKKSISAKSSTSPAKPITSLYVCQSSHCRRQIRITAEAKSDRAANPRCTCGAEMKKSYASPRLALLTKDEGLRRMATISKAPAA